jgi:hypothetical protein
MLYSPPMPVDDRADRWANRLRAWGVADLAAAFLEPGSPIAFLGAQVLHFGAPLLSLVYDPRELSGLAELLEDPLQTRRLAAGLTAADQETKA